MAKKVSKPRIIKFRSVWICQGRPGPKNIGNIVCFGKTPAASYFEWAMRCAGVLRTDGEAMAMPAEPVKGFMPVISRRGRTVFITVKSTVEGD